jgi:hypothetical protein
MATDLSWLFNQGAGAPTTLPQVQYNDQNQPLLPGGQNMFMDNGRFNLDGMTAGLQGMPAGHVFPELTGGANKPGTFGHRPFPHQLLQSQQPVQGGPSGKGPGQRGWGNGGP